MAFLWPMCSALNVAVLAIYGLSLLVCYVYTA